MKEEWKDINGFIGIYQVSNLGRVKSLERNVTYKDGSVHCRKETILKQTPNDVGYPTVNLCKNGKKKTHTVHRLVAEAFIPNPDNKPTVDHIDTDRTNNKVDNLRWFTQKEQMNENEISKKRNSDICKKLKKINSSNNYTQSKENIKKAQEYNRIHGYKCNKENSKKANAARMKRVRCITTGKEFKSLAEAARFYNIKSSSGISANCKGNFRYTYAGTLKDGTPLTWEYIE